MAKSHLEMLFTEQLKDRGLTKGMVPEFRFAKPIGRQWRADFAWPEIKVLVEIEGGISIRGDRSHTGAKGYENDCRKYNAAMRLGYRVLRYTASMLYSNEAIDDVERMVKNE